VKQGGIISHGVALLVCVNNNSWRLNQQGTSPEAPCRRLLISAGMRSLATSSAAASKRSPGPDGVGTGYLLFWRANSSIARDVLHCGPDPFF
jgi:hypothetical protein